MFAFISIVLFRTFKGFRDAAYLGLCVDFIVHVYLQHFLFIFAEHVEFSQVNWCETFWMP